MVNIIIYFYEFCCAVFPAIFVLIVLCAYQKRHQIGMTFSIPVIAVFTVYLAAVLHFTGAGTLHDAIRFGIDFNPSQINLIPFNGFEHDIEGHILNILLFMPLGIILPLSVQSTHKAWVAVVFAAIFSIAIELSQFMNSRVTDIDDVMMNILGAFLGYITYCILTKVIKRELKGSVPLNVVIILTCSVCLGRFLFYDEFGLAKILFGF